jgi:outer membrane lipoprotein SlyB
MRIFSNLTAAAALAAVTATSFALPADAAKRKRYYGNTQVVKVCRQSPATTGTIAGGVGGAILGSKELGGGLLGTAAGAVAGAVAGRAVDKTITAKRRCYYRSR